MRTTDNYRNLFKGLITSMLGQVRLHEKPTYAQYQKIVEIANQISLLQAPPAKVKQLDWVERPRDMLLDAKNTIGYSYEIQYKSDTVWELFIWRVRGEIYACEPTSHYSIALAKAAAQRHCEAAVLGCLE